MTVDVQETDPTGEPREGLPSEPEGTPPAGAFRSLQVRNFRLFFTG